MTFSDTAMMELGITQSTDIHNTRSLIRALRYVLDILQTEEPSRWKNINTHTHLSTMSRLGANGLAVAVDGKCVSLDLI